MGIDELAAERAGLRERIAEAIRSFNLGDYGMDDVDPRSQYAEWVPDLAEKIAAELDRGEQQ